MLKESNAYLALAGGDKISKWCQVCGVWCCYTRTTRIENVLSSCEYVLAKLLIPQALNPEMSCGLVQWTSSLICSMCHFMFQCMCTTLLWLYRKISNFMIASVLEGSLAHRLHVEKQHLLSHSLMLVLPTAHRVTPYSTDLVPMIKCLFVHCVLEFFPQLRATMEIPTGEKLLNGTQLHTCGAHFFVFFEITGIKWRIKCSYSARIHIKMTKLRRALVSYVSFFKAGVKKLSKCSPAWYYQSD